MTFLWKLLLGGIGSIIKPLFDFLNARVEAGARIHISDNETMERVGSTQLQGLSKADELNAQIRLAEGKWSPWVVCTIVGFMVPCGWHFWQVVLDSSRWIPTVRFWFIVPYLTVIEHRPGSWAVEKLPGLFETTEHAIITSLFIGAATAVTGASIIKAIKR